MKDFLKIGQTEVKSRLFIGSGKFATNQEMPQAIEASGAQVITVAVRRIDMEYPEENILNAEEAVRIARLARAAGCGDWIKIEVISDSRYLLPDNVETVKATEILAAEGFTVLPYMSPDLMTAKRLQTAGAAAVMPLGAPIGSNRGLQTKELIRILIEEIDLPIIVDAGIGKPSDAAEAMEMGAAAVLLNTAIATAKKPALMAEAFALAVKAGRKAYLAGLGRVIAEGASASSPLTGFLHE